MKFVQHPIFLFSSDGHVWTPIHVLRDTKLPPIYLKNRSSSWKDFYIWSLENGTFPPLITNTPCVLSGCPDLSQIGFGIGWVGWKNFARLATSSCDCRTTSPFDCWSTVEPNGTSSLAQSWSSEIFGGGRGDMYAFSNKTSPVFSLTKLLEYNKLEMFLEGWLHSIESYRMLILSELQDQYQPNFTAPWCFFHALCKYCARRGTEKSIFSGSLCSLSLGSIGKKNTVCLLLEFWPPSINPLLMIEWRFNAHPLW